MENENKNAYSEVIEILKLIDDEKKLEALPMEMLEVLKAKANPEYKPTISKEIPLDEQNLMPETFSILSWITQKYWNNEISESYITKDEKQTNDEISNSIEENVQTQKKIKNSEEHAGSEITIKEINDDKQKTNMPILYKDLKWYEKIKIKIVEFFNKIFKIKNKSKDESENVQESKE